MEPVIARFQVGTLYKPLVVPFNFLSFRTLALYSSAISFTKIMSKCGLVDYDPEPSSSETSILF
jgi:hypothetical protein